MRIDVYMRDEYVGQNRVSIERIWYGIEHVGTGSE